MKVAFAWVRVVCDFLLGYVAMQCVRVHSVLLMRHWIESKQKIPPVYDLVHETLPLSFSMQEWHNDVWVPLQVFFTLAHIFCRHGTASIPRHLHTCLFTFAVMSWLRFLLLLFNRWPDPSPECGVLDKDSVSEWVWLDWMAVWRRVWTDYALKPFSLTKDGSSITCGDMMYSGHTILNMILMLYAIQHVRSVWIRGVMVILSLQGCLSLVAHRIHYSADVIVASVITALVYREIERAS